MITAIEHSIPGGSQSRPPAAFANGLPSDHLLVAAHGSQARNRLGKIGAASMARLEPGPPTGKDSVTALLIELRARNRAAEALLIPRVYSELRRLAAHYMRSERKNHTLQPTALVNEAYTRLVQQPQVSWQNRAHFFATASHLMRHILVDHARARQAAKRGGVQRQVTLGDDLFPSQNRTVDLLILDEALDHLAQFDTRQARIVELHCFGGLSFNETAEVLKVSERTVERGWTMARAWLRGELSKQP